MVKSHSEVFTNINGQKEAHSNINEQLNENGKLIAKLGQQLDALPGPNGAPIAKLRTNVDIPSKGIHKSIEQPLDSRQFMQPTENGNRRAPNMELLTANPDNLDKYGSYSGIQYTPLDMAEYVFWTGDEKGVTLAIEEFLQEGLVSFVYNAHPNPNILYSPSTSFIILSPFLVLPCCGWFGLAVP
ncbi:nucleotidase domain-containing [Holotrichia oblita]|uniref:Nucleotidase domain-containing n=1 Tax=Holotrichia oblita TaxID=644536 RepID=A0ACB9T0G6_HOLOL|nr:nucleotidase domain-containing [Holotrichia oblita]